MIKKRFYLVKDKIENYISYIDENNFIEIKKIRHLKNLYKIKNENIGNDSFSIINNEDNESDNENKKEKIIIKRGVQKNILLN